MPTLRALECLVAVVEAGSVTTAAARLHASQPAVSHQLAALERELGVPLLERLPRGVLPTAAGQAVLDDARAALAAAERVTATGRRVARGDDGTLRVGCASSVLLTVLPPTLRRWHRRHPRVEVVVTEADSADRLVADLEAGRLDVVVAPRPSATTGRVRLVGVEDVLLVLPSGHPVAAHAGPVPVADLDGRSAVLYPPGHGLGGWVDALLAGHGVAVRAVLRTRQATGAAQLAASGLGVAFVPAGAVPSGLVGELRALDPPARRDIVAVTVGDRDPLARRFVDDLVARGIPLGTRTRGVATDA